MSDQIPPPPPLPMSTPMPPPPPQRPTRRPAAAPDPAVVEAPAVEEPAAADGAPSPAFDASVAAVDPVAPIVVEAPAAPAVVEASSAAAESTTVPVASEAPGAAEPTVAAPVAVAAAATVAAPVALAVEPDASQTSPGSTGFRRSLVFALIVLLVIGGVVGALLVTTGGDDTSADVVVDAEAVAVPVIDETTTPTTTIEPTSTAAVITAAPTTAPSTTTAPTTTEAPATTTVPAPGYPTLPDGSPEPIVAIFDGPVVRVTGWVPSAEKATQLEGLALANSTDPNAVVDSQLQIDPLVPLNIGTRVIEMNSPRFAAGSSDVTLEHAVQLDRVASVLGLLPNVTVTVVGHADQLGDATANYALSEARAVSVVRYLVGAGIDPARLSSRAMGEQDLLAGDGSAASLALNRRTEFIFYGLLAD